MVTMNAAIASSSKFVLKNMHLKSFAIAFVASSQKTNHGGCCHQLVPRSSKLDSSSILDSPTGFQMRSRSEHDGIRAAIENSIEICVPTADDMEDIGGILSVGSTGGDVILLDGDLGAGKTCFSRGFIRGRTGRYDERVTSPTYLLSNLYDADDGRTKIYHMDLYRLSGSEKGLRPLNLDHVFSSGISLIEWPSRLSKKPPDRLEVTLTIDSSTDATNEVDEADSKYRRMTLVPFGTKWTERLQLLQSEGLLDDLM